MPEIDLALCIYYLNPQASYLLSSSTPPHHIVEWRGPGPQPTQADLEAAWLIVSHPDWIDRTHPAYEFLVWKRAQLTGSPPPSHIELWEVVKVMLARL